MRASIVLLLAACVTSPEGESLTVLRSDADAVVLRGLIDATRTRPPERYDRIAAEHCAAHGKAAEFTGMAQHSTFAFDVAYACVARS